MPATHTKRKPCEYIVLAKCEGVTVLESLDYTPARRFLVVLAVLSQYATCAQYSDITSMPQRQNNVLEMQGH